MVSGPLALALPQSAALRRLRGIGALTWLGHPSAYAVGVCVVSLMSMATTLVAPRLLDPAAFGAFAAPIVLVGWLWLSNVALLFGAELNAEIERDKEFEEGVPEPETLNRPARTG